MKKAVIVATLMGVLGGHVFAQANPSKPAQPTKADSTPKIENRQKAGSKGTMTRDELRNCMKLAETIRVGAAAIDQQKPQLEKDRAMVEPAEKELATLRVDVASKRELVQLADAAVREFSATIDQWNADVKAAEESSMKSAERRKKELQSQQSGLVARNKVLAQQRDERFKDYEAAVSKFNGRGKELDASIAAWNLRNQGLADEADKLSEMREDYAADCSNRRFREEDETAVKQGK